MNDRATDTLRYFFKFLKKVSLRSAENKMDSNNLAVIFAPNLLQSSEPDKMSAHTERKLRLQAAVLQTLIDHAEEIGHVPKLILEKIPAMLGIDDPVTTPKLQDYEESEIATPGEHTRNRGRSIGVFPSVTPVIVTPNFKRKYPADSCQGFSSKKRRSIRHSLGLELLPSSIFSISSTPGSAQFEMSPSMLLEASQSSLSTLVTSEKHLHSIGSRRSKRIANKKVRRVESGKTGCFSPKISRKEMVRRSLRLKFILGRSSKENTAMENLSSNRSENIGRRLASQQDMESGVDSVKTIGLLSPCVGSKNISKSEDNLHISNCNEASYRMSWTSPNTTESQKTSSIGTTLTAHVAAEMFSSEPALTAREPPVIPVKSSPRDGRTEQDNNKLQTSFCEDENDLTANTLLQIKKAFSESGSNLHNLFETETSKSNLTQGTTCSSEVNLERALLKAKAQKVKNTELGTLFMNSTNKSSAIDKHLSSTDQSHAVDGSLFQNTSETDNPIHGLSKRDGSVQEDQLIAMTSPDVQLDSAVTLQKEILESTGQFTAERMTEDKEFKNGNAESEIKECFETGELLPQLPKDGDGNGKQYLHMETHEKSKTSPSGKVADHIHWFNKLSLNEPCSASKPKPPLTFQRTPVRQSIRRMNSLLEANKQSVACKLMKAGEICPSLPKSVSYETALSSFCAESISNTSTSSLSSEPTCKPMSTCDQFAVSSRSSQFIHPLEQAVRPGTTCKETESTNYHSKSVLEDLTNHETPKTVVKMNTSGKVSVGTPDKCVLRKTAGKKARYRGSPKNPIATAKLHPTVKPLDL
ncbi:rho GTPase-activating protein 11A isoform X2 [Elgaria multicarinata webbii]|uniref:rho GTPase-activating protein 11A isoform X2 n=1 Tax=Elgaria multicarinata webbii TaxID=159646 RepID=UPI002FCD19C5